MAIYIFNAATGVLVSYCPNDTDQVAPDPQLAQLGLSKLSGQPQLDTTHQWDAASKSVITVVAPTPVRYLSVFDFVNRFTAAELAAVRASANAGVQKFVFMIPLALNQVIDLNSTTIQNVMAMLVTQGLLSQARADAIVS